MFKTTLLIASLFAVSAVAAPPSADKPSAAPAAAKNFPAADIPFAPFNPKAPKGIHVYPLMGNPAGTAFTAVVRFPAGYKAKLHSHKHNYAAVALTEGLVHGTTEATAVPAKAK